MVQLTREQFTTILVDSNPCNGCKGGGACAISNAEELEDFSSSWVLQIGKSFIGLGTDGANVNIRLQGGLTQK